MAKNQPISVKDTVFKLQLALLDGVKTLDHLYLAGSIISRADYDDVVTERSIADLCGYPLCYNALPSESSRPHKGRYRISLKEHKVYDLHETYMYCCSNCVIESKAFAQSLSKERCDVLDIGKVERVLNAFGDVGDDKGELGDLGISGLKIEEKTETESGDMGISGFKIKEKSGMQKGDLNLMDWIGPSNAIEGYVPQKERISKPLESKKSDKGSKGKDVKISDWGHQLLNDMDFTSVVITNDEYSVSKIPPSVGESDADARLKESKGKGVPSKIDSKKKSGQSKGGKRKNVKKNAAGIQEVPSTSDTSKPVLDRSSEEAREEVLDDKAKKSGEVMLRSSLKHSGTKKLNHSVTWADETSDSTGSRNLCEVREREQRKGNLDGLCGMLKSSITLVDEKVDSTKRTNICEIREELGAKEGSNVSGSLEFQNNERVESAEACAIALSQAAEAVASGEFDVNDAVLGAGIVILPCPDGADEEEPTQNVAMLEPEQTTLKSTEDFDMLEPEHTSLWPRKPGLPDSDLFDPEDSLLDSPPEGFSLTLSTFATMWDSLFTWITCSTLAYLYGRDESSHEEFLIIDGREYPRKIILADGRSSEINQTLAESLARALPGVVSELNLATPVSTLEQGMGRMLETMSFMDALPAFRMKQWKVIVLLFLEGLSVCRIPALTPHLTNRRILFHKVLDGSQISAEEYEFMKDLMIPLGRAPQFSAQRGA